MQKELEVLITPAIVSANFEDLKAYLAVEVKKYEVTVEADTVKAAKKLATELNAVSKGINTVKKEQLEILEAPANQFKAHIAELNQIVQGGRSKILEQVKAFEDRTRESVEGLLCDLLLTEYEIQTLGQEYRTISIHDLILVSSITEKGNLTKKASDAVKERVTKEKAVEREVEIRLLQLSNECFLAGLKVPLSPEYIKDFLKAESDEYHHRLKALIAIELKRQADAEAKIITDTEAKAEQLRINADRERKLRIKAENKMEGLRESAKTPAEPVKSSAPIAEAPEGKKTLRIALSFDIIVREHAPEEKVLAKMRDLLEKAGIPTLNSITIES